MSRAAQEMQRIADEMEKARRQPTKGRHKVEHDELEDVTQGEAHDEHRATGDAAPPAADAPPAAAAEETTDMAKSASAIRSAKWRAKQKKKTAAKTTKPAKRTAAAAAPAATDRASVKALGNKLAGERTVFVTTTVSLARRAFGLLQQQAQDLALSTDPNVAAENAAAYTAAKKIVDRLGA